MRFSKKYKDLSKLREPLPLMPSRVQKFRRPKWKILQDVLASPQRKPRNFLGKRSNSYKEGILLKRRLISSFDFSFKPSFFRKAFKKNYQKTIHRLLIDCMVRPLFRIDVLLSRLFLFSSPHHSRQEISNGRVTVNSSRVKGNYFLKKGDLIEFSNTFDLFEFENISSRFLPNKSLNSFIEIDYYSNVIIIVKDVEELTPTDLILSTQEAFNIRKFMNYLG
jgi:ribosomal 50S subunit-recycling heat shock protein